MEQKTVIRNEVISWRKEGKIKLFRKQNRYRKTIAVLVSSVISAVRAWGEEA